jgi:hypothetical protein
MSDSMFNDTTNRAADEDGNVQASGGRDVFYFGRTSTLNETNDPLYFEIVSGSNAIVSSATVGYPMTRSGSILGIATMIDPNDVTVAGDLDLTVQINGVDAFTIQPALSALETTYDFITQAAGIDTFVAGDVLSFYYSGDDGTIEFNANPLMAVVEVQYD